jgi:hypothetical protein
MDYLNTETRHPGQSPPAPPPSTRP